MKWKLVVSLLALSLLALPLFFGVATQAQENNPKVDIFAGYSYVRLNPSTAGARSFSLNGGSGSVAYNVNGWLSGVADFGGYTNGNILGSNASGTLSTYLFGPRVSYRHYRRITPFGEALFGVARASARVSGASATDNAFSTAIGVGVDYKLSDHFAVRPLKVDYLISRFNETGTSALTQNNLRASTGIVIRF